MFEIRPYHGAGPVRFGMTQDEVVATAGKPALIRKVGDGEIDMRYSDYFVRLGAADQAVSEIGFSQRASVKVNGIDVFGDPRAFDKLTQIDGDPFESVGIVVLMQLGIALTGFHDAEDEQKSLTAFRRGRWDEAKNEMRSYTR